MNKEQVSERLLLNRSIDEETGCWEWTGAKAGAGYGHVVIDGKFYYTHRLAAFVWLDFDLRSPLLVCHNCPSGDNRRCFNPAHLFIGTQTDNLRDCVAKGRHKPARYPQPGEMNPRAKLTEEEVRGIKRRLADGGRTTELAREFQVVPSVISNIKYGRRWKHVA